MVAISTQEVSDSLVKLHDENSLVDYLSTVAIHLWFPYTAAGRAGRLEGMKASQGRGLGSTSRNPHGATARRAGGRVPGN